ncbi:MAG: glycosyltransferase involved in cell wall biosynthesis [Flavobacteriales bacterium]|jgi:glycosyltransferase involved in cell wall biosynthesis|tara:strand:- start:4693 stop:6006 length:1314 start_codon:yes stop_codon:yes gene_type:complete
MESKPLKVLMFGWEFPPEISGGLGTACYGLVSGLIDNGVDVTFVVPKLYGTEETDKFRLVGASDINVNFSNDHFNKNLEKVKYLQIHSHILPYVSPQEFLERSEFDVESLKIDSTFSTAKFSFGGKYGKNLLSEVSKYAVVAMQIAQDQDFDVIHAHDWLTFPAAIMAKEVSGKKLVVHIHATEFDRSGDSINQEVYEMERQGCEAADRIICVSRLTRRILINRYGIDGSKISVVHNAVVPKPAIIYPKKNLVDKKIVTFLGRITFQKGPDYFVEAAKKVLEVMPDAHFVMAGNGDMFLNCLERAAELKISKRFHFTGFLNYFETNNLFGMTDVYVMPSVSEPFGITPLEAMRTGVPVIISKQSGVSEVLNNAIKVDFWDVNALSDTIIGLLKHEEVSKQLAGDGTDEVHEMKWEYAALKVREIYNKTIDRRRSVRV